MKKEKKEPPSEPAQPNEDKMAVDPGLPAKPAPPIARKEEDKKEQAASQPEQVLEWTCQGTTHRLVSSCAM